MAKFVPPIVRGAFAFDADLVSQATGLECRDESLTVQSDAEEADINTLVRRFGITGTMPQNVRVPLNAEFVGALDYQSAMNAMIAAQASFMEMPAEVRARFDHNPAKFVDFCSDSANLPEMRKLGLAVPEVAPADAPAPAGG